MNHSRSSLNNIKSLYCLKIIVSYIKNNNTKLRLFKYNKNLREKLDISNFSYEKYIYLIQYMKK